MADAKYYTLSEEALTKLCGLIRESHSVSEGISDDSVATNSTFSSVRIQQLMDALSEEDRKYTEDLVANLNRLVTEVVDTIPTVDTAKSNTLYLYKDASDTGSTYTQYMLIDGAIITLGTTEVNLDNYYTSTACDNKFATKVDLSGVTNVIGDATTLTTNAKVLVDAINELKAFGMGKSAYQVAVDNGFDGSEEEWLESLNGEKGDDGRSIKAINKDNNNNIIVTFSDNTTENIGELSVDIQGDFLTENGFGNLRFVDNKFQYYDKETSQWVDTFVSSDNAYIITLTPQPMDKFIATCNPDTMNIELKIDESSDTIVDGQPLCIVEKVIIRRKKDDFPTDENDGDLVLEISRKDFGTYKNIPYVDVIDGVVSGETYCYKAFPVSNTGIVANVVDNEVSCTIKDYWLYGFKLDQNESDPASMITYVEDNENYSSAYMNYSTDMFDYGDWKDAWFIKNLKPCMLNYDGTVAYELNKDDYTLKADGTASDIANDAFGGNAMIGFPKVYWKIVDNGDDTANIYFSDKQVDTDFHCWSHIDNNGSEIDYCYMPIYNGSYVSGKLRSLSGKAPMASQTATTEITYAKANNTGSDIIWYTELFNDRMLINLLLLLIGKSTDTQTVFGTGNNRSNSIISTGTMNTKGLFWGNQDNVSGVKVFGMEHWWGNIWRRIGGWINDKGTQKIKMTYGQSDGSTTDGYNETGSGYISIDGSTPSGTNSGYISKMLITDNGLIPTIVSGSATTYYCDGLWFDNSQVAYVLVCGCYGDDSRAGVFFAGLTEATSNRNAAFSASISCKPLATT